VWISKSKGSARRHKKKKKKLRAQINGEFKAISIANENK
jgi:hypothetical protein